MSISAFKCYVLPILEYCSFVWNLSSSCDIDIKLVENVQKCFTRRVFERCNLPKVCYSERLSFLHVYSLEHLRLLSSICMFHSLFHKFVNCSLRNIIPSFTTNLRGNCCKLFVHRSRLNLRKSFLTNRCIPICNSLPDVIVKSNVSAAFKLRLENADLTRVLITCNRQWALLSLVYSCMFAWLKIKIDGLIVWLIDWLICSIYRSATVLMMLNSTFEFGAIIFKTLPE